MSKEQQIEVYLSALRVALGPIQHNEREEIVREIAAHIRDSAEQPGASVDVILQRLGPAEKLAGEYRDGELIRQASRSISPLLLLHALLRLTTQGVSGLFVFLVALFGYVLGVGLVLSALLKPLFPDHVGVWLQKTQSVTSGDSSYSTTITTGAAPHEILGFWIIPLALILGSLTLLFTTYAIRKTLRLSRQWQERLGAANGA